MVVEKTYGNQKLRLKQDFPSGDF